MIQVIISKKAQKQLRTVPAHVEGKFQLWVKTVETCGIEDTRKISGYHDEPLKGKRFRQRSVRLSKAYRAIYVEKQKNIIIEIIEVCKHDY